MEPKLRHRKAWEEVPPYGTEAPAMQIGPERVKGLEGAEPLRVCGTEDPGD
jgi:hypothetical protein